MHETKRRGISKVNMCGPWPFPFHSSTFSFAFNSLRLTHHSMTHAISNKSWIHSFHIHWRSADNPSSVLRHVSHSHIWMVDIIPDSFHRAPYELHAIGGRHDHEHQHHSTYRCLRREDPPRDHHWQQGGERKMMMASKRMMTATGSESVRVEWSQWRESELEGIAS